MSPPTEIAGVVDELDVADGEAVAFVAGLDDAQANWQPGGGTGWSIAQCLDHLARANAAYLGPIEAALRGARVAGRRRGTPSCAACASGPRQASASSPPTTGATCGRRGA